MISAIIVAAGSGVRAGFRENKVLRELNGLPVLSYSLSAFAPLADEMLVACREEDKTEVNALLRPYPNARTVRGGKTRGESVCSALKEAAGDVVLIHDAARPFVTDKIIRDCIASVEAFGSGVCALPSTDTAVLAQNGEVKSVPPRDEVFTVQTPQGFYRATLLTAYERALAEGAEFTDDGGLYSKYVGSPRLFLGDRANKKLTFAEDFLPAERVGFGVDTHAFYDGDEGAPLVGFITLGGVRIPSDRPLKAHSDGDVLVHALMDALLSAAGLRDIGCYFPDTDEKFRNADSMKLLAEVMRLVREAGYSVANASVSILAETPRLSPHIEEMKRNLSAALNLTENAVGIAAGTNEKLGYIGEGKGITCYATVLLK